MSIISMCSLLWKNTEKNDAKHYGSMVLPGGIAEIRDVAYMTDGDRYHLFDCYYPEGTDKALPTIIDIHGGGWMYADKDLNKFYCQYLAKRGYTVFSLSYSLVPSVTVQRQLQEVSLALKYIGEHAADFPMMDTDKIMLTGDSAGGQLAAYTAALAVSPYLREQLDTDEFKLKFDCVTLTSPVAYMKGAGPLGAYGKLMWGEKPFRPTDRRFLTIEELIPFAKDYPRTLLVTSSGDFLAKNQTIRLYNALRANGTNAVLRYFPKFDGVSLPHVFAVLEPYSAAGKICLDETLEFFMKDGDKNGQA